MKYSFRLLMASAISASCSAGALAHDPKGLKSEQLNIAKLSSPAAQKLLRVHQSLQSRAAQVIAIEEATKIKSQGEVVKRKPLDPGQVADPEAQTALQSVLEQVGQANARWQPGQQIRICFMDGSDASRTTFMDIANELASHTSLSVMDIGKCGNAGSHVHVSFEDSGYYSYVGTDALFFDESTATLNLEGMGANGNWIERWRGIARHEVGHMLAMLHEHQHPDMDCGFKSDEEIGNLLGWTVEEVKTNFGKIQFTSEILKTSYDPKSNMHYQLDPVYFKDGEKSACYITATNDAFSLGDIDFLKLAYPK